MVIFSVKNRYQSTKWSFLVLSETRELKPCLLKKYSAPVNKQPFPSFVRKQFDNYAYKQTHVKFDYLCLRVKLTSSLFSCSSITITNLARVLLYHEPINCVKVLFLNYLIVDTTIDNTVSTYCLIGTIDCISYLELEKEFYIQSVQQGMWNIAVLGTTTIFTFKILLPIAVDYVIHHAHALIFRTTAKRISKSEMWNCKERFWIQEREEDMWTCLYTLASPKDFLNSTTFNELLISKTCQRDKKMSAYKHKLPPQVMYFILFPQVLTSAATERLAKCFPPLCSWVTFSCNYDKPCSAISMQVKLFCFRLV